MFNNILRIYIFAKEHVVLFFTSAIYLIFIIIKYARNNPTRIFAAAAILYSVRMLWLAFSYSDIESLKSINRYSEFELLFFSLIVGIGVIGENRENVEWWKRKKSLFAAAVAIGVMGEFLSDGAIYLVSEKMQRITETELGKAEKEAGEANEKAATIEKIAKWRTLPEDKIPPVLLRNPLIFSAQI